MKHILIIDDDIHIGNMLEEVLIKEGYQVSRAYSGTEALLALSGCKPDLILLDLMLPGLSGEEVLPKLKGIPVIVVSAKIDVEDKVGLLLDRISGDTPDCTESSLKMHVSKLRKKLRDVSGKDYIEAVWGIGFKLKTE